MSEESNNTLLHSKTERGAVILVALFVTFLVGVVVAGFLKLSVFELTMSERALLANPSLNIAESGADDAAWALNREDWSEWTLDGDFARKEVSDIPFSDGKTGEYSVIVEDYSSEPIVFVEAKTSSPSGLEFSRQIKLTLSLRSPWANGMTAKDEVIFNGASIDIDSYNSQNGPYHPVLNRGDRGTVGSNTLTATVDVSNALIYGYLATGGAMPSLGPNAEVRGENTPPAVQVDLTRITYDFFADLPDVNPPTLTSPFTSLPPKVGDTITIGDPTGVTVEEYHLNDITLSGSFKKLKIVGPVVLVVDDDVGVSGSRSIDVVGNGSARFYVGGDFDLGGSGLANSSGDPAKVFIYGTDTVPNDKTFTLHGSAALYAAVYAPNAELIYSGTVDHCGSIIANKIRINGNVSFHYDEALEGFASEPTFRLESWRELVSQEEKIDFETYGSGS